ncbi:MAG: MarR family transcriptional regulator [Rhizobiaceae bacterium]|nr:MarR family transcriptional regulator [Rhizobiaceae bacterium]
MLEDFLAYRLHRLADLVSRDFARVYRDQHGLSRPEWRTLSTLGQFGSMTATAIGGHSAMHKTKVSRAVAELERRRWLVRRSDPRDRRTEHLELSKAGLEVYRQLVPLARRFEDELLQRLAPSQRRSVVAAIEALEAAVDRD